MACGNIGGSCCRSGVKWREGAPVCPPVTPDSGLTQNTRRAVVPCMLHGSLLVHPEFVSQDEAFSWGRSQACPGQTALQGIKFSLPGAHEQRLFLATARWQHQLLVA